ncbi:unnamed protein product [Durusdinium trenchii]|uniref:Uncharacterized protein n=1 Tax=Durusdinium trenchii TaxID=1381693 RepID=A0ABP0LDF7_9DINO
MFNNSFQAWSFSVLGRKPDIIQHARKMVEHHQKNSTAINQFLESHPGTRSLVSNLTHVASRMQVSKGVWSNSWDRVRTLIYQVAYLVENGYLTGYQQIVLWLSGESTTS